MSPDISRKFSKRLPNDPAAQYLGISPSKLKKMRAQKSGPEFIRIGRAVRYDTLALDEWMTRHSVGAA